MNLKFFFTLILLVMVVSCKKDAVSINQNNDSILTGDSVVFNPKQNPNSFSIDPLNAEKGVGKTVFTKDGKSIIDFDNQGNIGTIKINGQDVELNNMTFSENNYQINGNDISIIAENGNFEEMVSDCNYGTFNTITIIYKNHRSILSNVKVQDCPSY